MGALHSGHVSLGTLLHAILLINPFPSLVQEALKKCDKVILSIFINPSQFAPHEDLNKYPKVLDEDLHVLSKLNSELTVFVPTVESMYPSGITTHVNEQKGTFVEVKGISHILEGNYEIFLIKTVFRFDKTTLFPRRLNSRNQTLKHNHPTPTIPRSKRRTTMRNHQKYVD